MVTAQNILRHFPTDDACLAYLFALRFPEVQCRICRRRNKYYRHSSKQCYTCMCGRDHIYPKKGTIFEGSSVSLLTWFQAMLLLYQSRNRMPVWQLQKSLQVNYATAKKMRARITAMLPSEDDWEEPVQRISSYLPGDVLERVCRTNVVSPYRHHPLYFHVLPMKSTFDHLPDEKREELEKIVSVIKNTADIEMIILFGSYARGDWVEDRYVEEHVVYEYQSDFDILVVVKDKELEQDCSLWKQIEDSIAEDASIKTPVSLLYDTIDYVNEQLSDGRYFYKDIQKEGVMLYNAERYHFTTPRTLSAKERQELAKADFSLWMGKARDTLDVYTYCLSEDKDNLAAFNLHQACESLLICFLLVRTGYRAKTHDLEKLLRNAVLLDTRFQEVFPRKTTEEMRLFTLLRQAYIDARYRKSYTVQKSELESLHDQAQKLQELVDSVCTEVIEELV